MAWATDPTLGGSFTFPPSAPPPVTGGVPTHPSSITISGAHPDYSKLLAGDPGYMAWLAAKPGREAALASSRAASIRALITRFGGVPAGFQDAYGDVTPADVAAAGSNQFSTEAEIQRGYEQGVEAMKKSLAARGGLQSGELGYGQSQADLGRGRAEYEATTSFMDAINAAISGYTSGVSGIEGELPNILESAQANVIAGNPDVPDVPANYAAAESTQYGRTIYKTDDGRLFNADGSPFVPSGAPAAASAAPPLTVGAGTYAPPAAIPPSVSYTPPPAIPPSISYPPSSSVSLAQRQAQEQLRRGGLG